MNREKELSDLVDELQLAAGSNLKSLVLYGSAAGGEFHEAHSDLNVLGIFERLDAAALVRLHPVVQMWTGKGHPAPLLLTIAELRSAADIYAIEFLDIIARRRTLAGEDLFATLEVPMGLHRLQVERELRLNVLRLRQAALVAGEGSAQLGKLMLDSVAAFCVLFRHALIALDEKAPDSRRESCRRLAALLRFDSAPLETVLDVRESKQPAKALTADTFAAYLAAVSIAAEQFDRRTST
jgi:predicted nucleotidyltransferase